MRSPGTGSSAGCSVHRCARSCRTSDAQTAGATSAWRGCCGKAGVDETTPDDFRTRQIGEGAVVAAIAGLGIAVLTHSPLAVLVTAVAGYTVGSTRTRKRLEHAVTQRAARIRQELYTVNHLLAMHVRTGSGPIQAVQRVVDRGRGVVVEELGCAARARSVTG